MNEAARTIQRRALQSQALSEWIASTADGSGYPDVPRLRLALASFDVSFQHHLSISQLVVLNGPVSAMASVRSQFESMVRGLWFINCATDDQITRFRKGKFDPKLSVMLTALRKHPIVKAAPLQAYLEGSGKRLHGWTHGGSDMLNALIESNGVADDVDVLDLLVTADLFALVTALIMAAGFNNNTLRQGATKRAFALSTEAVTRAL